MRAFQLGRPVDPGRDRLRGDPGAAVTLVEYGDYECPYSRQAYRSIQLLESRYGDRLRFVFRHFPLRAIHPHAQPAAEAAEEAAAQGRFWAMHDLLYHRQKALEPADLRRYAAEIGLDGGQFDAALGDGRHRDRIEEDVRDGLSSGVAATPTLYVNGVRYDGSYEPAPLGAALEGAAGQP